MMSKIPLSKDFSITPNTISPAGTALEANGLLLSDSNLVPVGTVAEFVNAEDVRTMFGALAPESVMSAKYFNGYVNSSLKPAKLLIGRLLAEDAPAYILSASLAKTKLADLVLQKGMLTVTVNSKETKSNAIDLRTATSFSDIADAITAAFAPDVDVTEVTFNPASVSVAAGKNTATVTYKITPDNATETVNFEVPEANKNDVKVDAYKKTITLTRNDSGLKYTVIAKGAVSAKTVGTLAVEFKADSESEVATPTSSKETVIVASVAAVKNESALICKWIPTAQRFQLSTLLSGADASITYATSDNDNALTEALKLTKESGALLSQGSDKQSPDQTMASITNTTQSFIGYAPAVVSLDDERKEALCKFASNSNSRYFFSYADNSDSCKVANNQECFQQKVVIANNYESVFAVYGTYEYAALPLAYCASINFDATNGRVSFKFRQFSGTAANVDSGAEANALDSNKYNYLGAYGLNNTMADYAAQGSITGQYKWLDTFIDQVWINANLVAGFANLFLANQSYPFNERGRAAVSTVAINVSTRATNYGAIQKGVVLDPEQIAIVTGQTGKDLTSTLFNQGWYFYIPPQTGSNRIERALKGAVYYWVDGQLIQSIQMASTTIL